MHAQHYCVEVGCDASRVPSDGWWQKPIALQPCACGIKDFVIRTGDLVSFQMKGDGEVVHGTAANGDEVCFHDLYSLG